MGQALEYFKRLGLPVFAPASAVGGPVCIIRISGNDLKKIEQLIGGSLPAPGRFVLRDLRSTQGVFLDRALVLFFKNPNSFTGESVVELHCHGILSSIENIQNELARLGYLPALPGEFSFRSVVNGKMTLEQSESLNFALGSENLTAELTENLLSPGASASLHKRALELWTALLDSIRRARGRVEAAVDFPEAEIEQAEEVQGARELLIFVKEKLQWLQTSFARLSRASEDPKFTIFGLPNAGKSTLLNCLVGVKTAIVNSEAGTTRDIVSARVKISSEKWASFQDTAGLRETNNLIETEGISLALDSLSSSLGLVWVESLEGLFDFGELSSLSSVAGLNEFVAGRLRSAGFPSENLQKVIWEVPKLIIFSHKDRAHFPKNALTDSFVGAFDFRNEEEPLRRYVFSWAKKVLLENQSGLPPDFFVSKRQSGLVNQVSVLIERALLSLDGKRPIELVGEDLREAEKCLELARGKNLTNAYIGEIFSQFCLGK